ncbi:MAG: glycosyltransferase family 2 protein [Clostridiales bacterium]|nr:glycosyltransferase family 2 protein [Clostridiales bacterium]
MKNNRLYMVIPCYNEEEVLLETARRLREKLTALMEAGTIAPDSRVLFVNDGSRDRTWEIIRELHRQDGLFCGVNLSRNRGHQNALLAGLMVAKDRCDMAISMDADLQDDIRAIDAFLEQYLQEGCDVVYGVRSSRETDTVFKRSTAGLFYRLMRGMGAQIVDNHADYRLMSRRALEALSQFEEVNLFLRGIVPMVGFKSSIVTYERQERFAGTSKYPLGKMLSFAFDGITSFSTVPIRFIAFAGFFIFMASLAAQVVFLVQKLLGYTVQGWATTMGSIWLIGGIQLLSLGVIGEYVGKIYMEVKHRPRFIIESILED